MDEQIVDLLRDQFKAVHDKIDLTHTTVNGKIDEMRETVTAHVEEDRRYWAAIDEQKAQMNLLKTIFGGASASGLLAWVYSKFGGR